MEAEFILKVVFEGITTATGFICAILVFFRSRKNLPNIYLATSFLLLGFYTGGVLIYDLLAIDASKDIFILIFIRVSLISILFAGMLLYFAMMMQAHSRLWITFKKNTLPWIILCSVYSLMLIIWTRPLFIPDWITINTYQPVDTTLNLYILFPLIILLFIFLISACLVLYNYGVKKTTGLKNRNMKRFLLGVLIAIGGTIVNVMGQLPFYGALQNTISQIMDIASFAIISISIIVMFSGLAIRSKKKGEIKTTKIDEKSK
ncbi:MAG: hypothetical protein JW776_15850 [Candidatus Lokiarchaeota archaeon]|nr:hypothetical protein [Candidatus Lokiarchaeota archaeon]